MSWIGWSEVCELWFVFVCFVRVYVIIEFESEGGMYIFEWSESRLWEVLKDMVWGIMCES